MKKLIGLLLTSLFIFTSCNQFFNSETVEQIYPAKTYVTFAVNEESTRTILPQAVTINDFSYSLTGLPEDGESRSLGIWENYDSMIQAFSTKIELEGLSWTFTLEAKKDGKTALTSTVQKSLAVGSDNSVTFGLKEAQSGFGKINVSISIPESLAQKITAGLFNMDGTGVSGYEEQILELTSANGKTSASYTKENIPCGNYIVKFFVYQKLDDANWMNVKTELIHVAPENLSSGSLNAEDLNVFKIEYDIGSSIWKDGFAPPTNYKINDTVDLPTAENMNLPTSAVFLGWHEKGGDGSTITTIDANTAGNKTYTADIEISLSELQSLLNKFNSGSRVRISFDKNSFPESNLTQLEMLRKILQLKPSLQIDLDFSKCSKMTKFGSTFYDLSECTCLTSIILPESVTFIGSDLFKGCTNLTSVVIPDGVKKIFDDTFKGCTSLYSVSLPNNLTSIGESAFKDCSSLTSIDIPESVTSIYFDAFEGCSSLVSINIPNGVTEIPSFEGCSSLVSINIPNGVTKIGSFSGCSSLVSINIPNGVTKIGSFNGCSSLTSIDIPNGVTSIEFYGFKDCTSLASISIPGSVTSIGFSAFQGCTSLASISIPGNVTSIKMYAFQGCTSLASISIPGSVTSIGWQAFEGCTSLKSISIPGSITSIGYNAFAKCSKLSSASISNGAITIGYGMFQGCTSLTSISMPNSIETIGGQAFLGCSSLASISIPDSVTLIGGTAFSGCSSLTEIRFEDTNNWYYTDSSYQTGGTIIDVSDPQKNVQQFADSLSPYVSKNLYKALP